jgi:hypothetical protein
MSLTRCARILALVAFAVVLSAQMVVGTQEEDEPRLPGGKSQKQEILKANHKRNLADATKLVELSESLKAELEKDEHYVLSLASLKKTEDIEKLARGIRNRLRQF